ncbi:GNAT family N-acetyltransferase/peptidase C39 family protein [Gilvimarinus sp. DA14]|uniref:GNAT family N-acetyltransferase/peptidase C39 family protein n=1 Tax=Gilvimarinus sp. DA14 TaxID=2956798 RepID=UPI0020B861ED|nr:GNAT family N-acetyltransferase/peptidase C39 family protein [Gilvimarinus sp. DA14]UTF59216.1 GNAT family N-acetyltransferase/peptidase C39 family protein [Gilvimarinus sp. DA14]
MSQSLPLRRAQRSDLDQLVALESRCFTSDKISRRSFRQFLESDLNQVLVAGEIPVAYLLLLFRRGTSMARIYSLAVDESHRGQGLARRLLQAAEQNALERRILFLRLEVATTNHAAIALYQAMGYHPIKRLSGYYQDGSDGLRLEKRLGRNLAKPERLDFYAQTTDFTCGPAAAIMAMRHLDPVLQLGRIDEINLWREATTVFMTQGHGGCSPQGLALALTKRDYDVRLLQSSDRIPFIDSVRNPDKKAVIELTHYHFIDELKNRCTPCETTSIDEAELRQAFNEGFEILLLISTYQLNRNKAPHWVWLVALDDQFAYINDPDINSAEHCSSLDNVHIPIPLISLKKLLGYGKHTYRAAVLFRNK